MLKNNPIYFKISLNKSLIPFTNIFINVWSHFSISSTSSHKSFVSFINNCTKMSWLYLLKSKNNVLNAISQFSKIIFTQFNIQVKVFHSKNGHEFVNQSLVDLFKEMELFTKQHTRHNRIT